MNPLVLAVALGQLASAPEPVRAPVETETLGQPDSLREAERAPVRADCRICLLIYVHNPLWPNGHQMIREECDFTPTTVTEMRSRQLQIAIEGTYSYLHWEDWGTWYGPHRIESVVPVLQPPCY